MRVTKNLLLFIVLYSGSLLPSGGALPLKIIAAKKVSERIQTYPKSTLDMIPNDLIPVIMQEDYMRTFEPEHAPLDKKLYSKFFIPSRPYDQILTQCGPVILSHPDTTTLFKRLLGHIGSVINTCYSNDTQYLATCSQDGSAKLWNLTSDEETIAPVQSFNGHTQPVNSVALSNNQKLLATASSDRTAKIWDIETGDCLHTLHGHDSRVNSISFSDDDTTLVTSSDDKLIILWDTHKGTQKLNIWGHTSEVLDAKFAANDTKIVSTDLENNHRVWDLELSQKKCFERWLSHRS